MVHEQAKFDRSVQFLILGVGPLNNFGVIIV